MAPNPQSKHEVIDAPFAAVGSQTRNATLSSAVTLTAPAGANTLWISVETQNVRLRFDGSDPTATVGLLLYAGQTYILAVSPLQAIKLIEVAASAVINYQWGVR
jgi:hypothetical protein